VVNSRPGCFTAREGTPGTYWTASWVGTAGGLNAVEKRKSTVPTANRTPYTSIVQPVAKSLYWLRYPDHIEYLGFEVFTAVVMKSIFFWDMTPCSPLSCARRFGGTYRLHLQGRRNRFSKPASKQLAGGDMFLRNVGWNSTDYMASYPRRWYSSHWILLGWTNEGRVRWAGYASRMEEIINA
jgi:hypothetical protein